MGAIALLFGVLSTVGITWGLPGRKIDKYLFGKGEVWPGEKIYRLAQADQKFSPTRGADVDADPLGKGGEQPVPLTATEADVARIYLRYRLYTCQPDEMIAMMALAGMRPGRMDFDPRLYQYGGLFIYPLGGLVRLAGMLGLIDVRSDVVYYLDHPDEFGKFYIVARAYSAAWGMIGVVLVYAVTRRLAGWRAGLLTALLFTLMPVVVCMAHEGKPHLPGAVLMLAAVLCGMRALSARPAGAGVAGSARQFWWMCVCCGAAFGMVLSSWPIFMLIPLVAWRGAYSRPCGSPSQGPGAPPEAPSPRPLPQRGRGVAGRALGRFPAMASRTVAGVAVGVIVYLVTNPYIVINAFLNREVLRSNFGNSLAMYEVSRIGEGFQRVLELTVEGATLPVLILGVAALLAVTARRALRTEALLVLAVPAVVFFLQFVLIGAGKPAEYGRFGVFMNAALAMGAAFVITYRSRHLPRLVRGVVGLAVVLWVGWCGHLYLRGFIADSTEANSRLNLARFCTHLARDASTGRIRAPLATFAEPAPYCFPPIDFAHANLWLVDMQPYRSPQTAPERLAFAPLDESRGLRPTYAATRGHEPILRTEQFAGRDADFAFLLDLDDGWRNRHDSFDTPISWANKPFLDSVLHTVADSVRFPLRR